MKVEPLPSPPSANQPSNTGGLRRIGSSLLCWFDTWSGEEDVTSDPRHIDLARIVPFVVLHLSCLLVLVVGWSWTAVLAAAGFYVLRMFAITAFYHRYFSHRAFSTSRPMQFAFALLGSAAIQRGPLWWAAHHRAHHRHSDAEGDVHSPDREGFMWSHLGWILASRNFRTRTELIRDFTKFPELRFLDRFDVLVPLLLIPGLWALGEGLQALGLGAGGFQFLVWTFSISTVALYHLTFCVNSLAHRVGSRRFETRDRSRNNAILAFFTLGEGWHNNHHHFPGSARQGFYWWEIDFSYYALRTMALFGLVWNLRPVPARVLAEGSRR